MKKRAVKKVL